jgi:hypothetical protein
MLPSMLEFKMLLIKPWQLFVKNIVISTASGLVKRRRRMHRKLRNFKLKKQVKLTTALSKELDSTMEEVEFWQEKYEEATKTIWKLKRRYPKDMEMLFEEKIEEVTPTSPPRKMATCAPPIYVIPNNDDD